MLTNPFIASLRTSLDESAVRSNALVRDSQSAGHTVSANIVDLTKTVDRVQASLCCTSQLISVVEGSLEALGPTNTHRLLTGLREVESTFHEVMARVTTANHVSQCHLDSTSRAISACRATDTKRGDLCEALTTALRRTAANADALENTVSWCRSYMASVVAERVQWQERNGLNPAMLPHGSFFPELCLQAVQFKVPGDTSIRAVDEPGAIVDRFVSRVDRTKQAEYVTPKEELAMVRALLGPAAFVTKGNDGRTGTVAQHLVGLKFKSDLLRSQLGALRDAVVDWRNQLINDLCIFNAGVERRAQRLIREVREISTQTEITALANSKRPPQLAGSASISPRSGQTFRRSPAAASLPPATEDPATAGMSSVVSFDEIGGLRAELSLPVHAQLRGADVSMRHDLPPRSVGAWATATWSTQGSPFVVAEATTDGMDHQSALPPAMDVKALSRSKLPMRLTPTEGNLVDSQLLPPSAASGGALTSRQVVLEEVAPRFGSKPSGCAAAVSRVDDKVQRALAAAHSLELKIDQLRSQPKAVGPSATGLIPTVDLHDTVPLAPQPPRSRQFSAGAHQARSLAVAKIDRVEFDRWLDQRFRSRNL